MDKTERNQLILAVWVLMPFMGWFMAVKKTETLTSPKIKALWQIASHTHEKPILLLGIAGGILMAALVTWLLVVMLSSPFTGQRFKRFLRGTKIVTVEKLKALTRERKTQQVTVGDIPVPTAVEPTHILVAGSTGVGKSVVIRGLAYSGILRGDRFVFCDPNGDLVSKFYRQGDKILNPYDTRTEGWTFYNEIRNDYDYKRYALSLVPRGKSAEEEEWCSFGRLLLAECAKKLAMNGSPSIRDLFHWCTIEEPENLKLFLAGTSAESLFVGAEKALASARFVLADKLPEHLEMPTGHFSIRRFLEDDQTGNLFLTWREDMAEALRPLISAWVDVVCTSVLSLPESKSRRIWLSLDELASLEKLASLQDALTKGRKHGLRAIAGLQTVSQLDDLYGNKEAQTLRACFRSLVVLGGANSDPETAEEMSKALGDHEVVREEKSRSAKGANRSDRTDRERVVMPSEIVSMPDLTAIVAFAGDRPIARTKLEFQQFRQQVPAFMERNAAFGG
ncbi:MAG: type IV secretion system DNA-binding domain-containing protein [Xanthomonas perforans]|nr:type IV secretion system DNA-binding domain-containing protein [Xanthomonas perforans]